MNHPIYEMNSVYIICVRVVSGDVYRIRRKIYKDKQEAQGVVRGLNERTNSKNYLLMESVYWKEVEE